MRQVLNDSQGVKSSDGSITVFAGESPAPLLQVAITFPSFRWTSPKTIMECNGMMIGGL
jgi:hypothetical protein